jgi:hypothetical protein
MPHTHPHLHVMNRRAKGRSLGTHQKVTLSRTSGRTEYKRPSLSHYASSITLPERQNGSASFPGSDDDKNTAPLTAPPKLLSLSLAFSLRRVE